MKKGAAILLAVFYLISVVSVTLNMHYCCGELVSISVFGKPKTCCGETGKEKGCCHNKTITYKVKDKHSVTTPMVVPKNSFKTLWVFPVEQSVLCFYGQPLLEQNALRIHAPPESNHIETWLFVRSILI